MQSSFPSFALKRGYSAGLYAAAGALVYITKIMEYVCPAMRFVMLWGMGLKLGMGIGDGPPRLKSIFSKWPHWRSKIIQRSNCHRNALWLPNLVGRTPDQRVMHCWGQGHAKVIWGQPGVKLLRNGLWPPNLVGRIPDQNRNALLG